MHGMQVSGIDTNLLVVLDALLVDQSVARAGARLGLSPSATSHALARLRALLGDPLLVRAGRRLVLTARAMELAPAARRIVSEIESVLQGPAALDPKTLRHAFRVSTTDHIQFVLLAALDAALCRQAPAVDMYCLPHSARSVSDLRDGVLDACIAVWDTLPDDIGRQALFPDRLVSVVRAGHSALRKKLTLQRFTELSHVLVAPQGTPHGLVDDLLAKRGLSRRIARTLPTFVDAPFLVAQTDYVLTLPLRVVEPLLKPLQLELLSVPLQLPRFTISMIWHRRNDAHPTHAWFRQVVGEAAKGLGPLAAAATRRRHGAPSLRP
jgi:DNA-binding transcriptional LysR family regulator